VLDRFAHWLIVLPIVVAVVIVQKIARERWGDWASAVAAIVTLVVLYAALHCSSKAMKGAAIRRMRESKRGMK